jgi:hypothetical protein
MESCQPIRRLKDKKKKIVVESGNRTYREDMLCVDGTQLPTEVLPLVICSTTGRFGHRDDCHHSAEQLAENVKM